MQSKKNQTNRLHQSQLHPDRKPELFQRIQPPEIARILKGVERRNHFTNIFAHVGKIVRFSSIHEIGTGKKFHQGIQGDDPSLFLLGEALPVAQMLFRPEEVHRASGIRNAENPSPDRNGNMTDQPIGFLGQNLAILYLDLYGFAAIQANRIDPDRLSRKKPADRQRLEGSLTEPLLLAVDGQAVMGREIVERSE